MSAADGAAAAWYEDPEHRRLRGASRKRRAQMSPSPMNEEQLRLHDITLQRAMGEPMPRELRSALATLIEPHTMNMYLDHGDTMTCIEVAWPVIRDYLRAHPEVPGDGG